MKKFLLLLIALMSMLVFTACGENEVDDVFELKTAQDIKDYGKDIKIKFRVPSGTISNALQKIIPEFEKEWDGQIKVDLEAISGSYDGVLTQNTYDLRDGKAPTMTIGYPDHLALYLSGEGLISLQPYIDAEEKGFLDDFVQAYLPENQLSDENKDFYGLPLNKSTEVLIYNKTVFDAMGYEIPTYWEDVEELGTQILEDVAAGRLDNINGIKYSEGDKQPSSYHSEGRFYPISYDSTDNAFITVCRQWDGLYTKRETLTKGYALFNNENAREGLAYFQDLASRKLFSVAENFDESYASNAFKNVQCLMTIGSSAGVGYNAPAGDKFELGVAPIPVKDDDHKYVIQQGTNVCILAQSTNWQRAACWQLIKFLTSVDQTVEFATLTGGYLPVRHSAYDTVKYQEFLDPEMNLIGYYYSLSASVAIQYRNEYSLFVDDAFKGSSAIREEVGTAFSKIIVKNSNIKTVLDDSLNTLGPKYQQK